MYHQSPFPATTQWHFSTRSSNGKEMPAKPIEMSARSREALDVSTIFNGSLGIWRESVCVRVRDGCERVYVSECDQCYTVKKNKKKIELT